MGMKHYPPQFKADAVALYHSRPGAFAAQVARDLGIYPATLLSWIRAAGEPDERAHGSAGDAEASAGSSVEAENRALRRRVAELEEEREILRRAAKYFAGETKW